MIKKVVVMAAGKGTRMKELGVDKPKHLIDVAGKPFLYHVLENLKEAGLSEIIIVVGYKKEAMQEFAKKYGEYFNLKLVDQFEIMGTEKYGTAIPILAVEESIGADDFMVINGDDLFSPNDLKRMAETENDFSYIAGLHHMEPKHFGILEYDENNFLRRIIEKPTPGVDYDEDRAMEYLISPGMYKFSAEIFDTLKRVEKSPRGEYELTDAITLLAQEKKVKIFPLREYWHTFGKPEDIAKVEEFLGR
jgi:UDP-N-acetylglucosamine diphosphorylase / glucose-1-phosphate thymidylyltransferase / UDP-N-acetylgalactosamine diphosphorylase / glucosamine-1-phosphate N-acetyltransferase / galactosamine-1-phosphate N-acetyltransferase